MTEKFKTFPFTPADLPNREYHVVNKKYVDGFPNDLTIWDDQQVSIGSAKLHPANTPVWTAYKGGYVLAFEGGGADEEQLFFTAQLSHKYKEGSDIEFHIHYAPEDATVANVRWVFTYSWASSDGVYGAETTVTTILATPGVADQHTYGEIGDITGTGKTISSILICSLMRESSHATDTYDNLDIYLLGLDFHIQCDAIGSSEEDTK